MPPGPDPQKQPETTAPHQQPPPVPQAQRPPPRRPLPPRPPPRPRRQHHRGKASRARIGLVVIFFLLRMADGFLLLVVPAGTPVVASPIDSTFNATFSFILSAIIPDGSPTFAIPGIICSTLWTTALLIAVWRRQYWARLILVTLFGLAALFVLLTITSTPADSPLFMTLMIRELVLLGSGAYMMVSRDMHRLTSRERS